MRPTRHLLLMVVVGGGAAAADIAAALNAATEHSRLEATKECTTTYEQERHANMMRLYKLTLDESEHGNRSALYKAHKHMGKDSPHQYPSGDQMAFMKVADAEGGGDLPQLVGQVGANGALGVGPGQAAPKHAGDAHAVANQAKLKMGTFLLELCGEPVPAGYDGKNAGLVPGVTGPTQMGLEERSIAATALPWTALLRRLRIRRWWRT